MFDTYDTSLEIFIQGLQLLTTNTKLKLVLANCDFPKKRHLGPQNGFESSRPEKLPKTVNCVTIKETGKNQQNNGEGPSGIGGWPPISIWISTFIHN